MKTAAAWLLLPVLALAAGCSLRPLAAELPAGATAEHLYLATLHDYVLLTQDVNAYLRLPSVTAGEARRLDEVLDRADAEIRRVDALRAAGVADDHYGLAAALLRDVARELCAAHPEVSTSCAGR